MQPSKGSQYHTWLYPTVITPPPLPLIELAGHTTGIDQSRLPPPIRPLRPVSNTALLSVRGRRSAVNTGNNSPVSYASGSRPRAWGKAFEDALAEIADPSLSPVKEVASPVEDLRYASPVDDLHYRR